MGVLGVRVQIPPDAQNGLLASVVRLVKFERVKIPETVDAVGVQPAASKLFGSFGAVKQSISEPDFSAAGEAFRSSNVIVSVPSL